MNAPTLAWLFDAIYLLSMTAWIGSIAFFSFAVAPIIFTILGPEAGGRFVRALFPRYYTWGSTCGAIALPALVCGPMAYPELRGPAVGIQAIFVLAATLIMLYCGNSLTPAINTAKDAGPASTARFNALHKRSVWLNSVVLLIGIGLIVGFAVRHAPKAGGIIERKPGELTPGQAKMLRDEIEIDRKIREKVEQAKSTPTKGPNSKP